MKRVSKVRGVAMVSLDHYRAARIVADQHGERAEDEILSHLVRMQDQEDTVGVQLWLNVLAALCELRRTREVSDLLH